MASPTKSSGVTRRQRRPRGTENALMMEILQHLHKSGGDPAFNRDLCTLLDVEPNHLWKLTVQLEEMGLIRRERGRLLANDWLRSDHEQTRFERSLIRLEPARAAVATYVANSVIEPTDEVIAMDSGATSRLVLEAASRLPGDRTVITNNLELANSHFSTGGTRIELLGGRLDQDSRATTRGFAGDPATAYDRVAAQSLVDLSIAIPLAASWEGESLVLWTWHPDEAPIRHALIAAGRRVALLVTPERAEAKGERFASIGSDEDAIRPLDDSVELVVGVLENDAASRAFHERARSSGAVAHEVFCGRLRSAEGGGP